MKLVANNSRSAQRRVVRDLARRILDVALSATEADFVEALRWLGFERRGAGPKGERR
jgi:hypothetical protein